MKCWWSVVLAPVESPGAPSSPSSSTHCPPRPTPVHRKRLPPAVSDRAVRAAGCCWGWPWGGCVLGGLGARRGGLVGLWVFLGEVWARCVGTGRACVCVCVRCRCFCCCCSSCSLSSCCCALPGGFIICPLHANPAPIPIVSRQRPSPPLSTHTHTHPSISLTSSLSSFLPTFKSSLHSANVLNHPFSCSACVIVDLSSTHPRSPSLSHLSSIGAARLPCMYPSVLG